MKTIIIDIETKAAVGAEMRELLERGIKPRANLVDPRKIAEDIENKKAEIFEKAALSPLTGELAVFGWAYSSNCDTWESGTIDAHDGEEGALVAISELMDRLRPEKIVTFYGTKFDIPFLAGRYTIRNMTSYPWPIARYSHPIHLDLHDALGGGSLEQWGVACGLLKAGKSSPSADVPVMLASGDWAGAIAHCAEDVEVTRKLYERLSGAANWR